MKGQILGVLGSPQHGAADRLLGGRLAAGTCQRTFWVTWVSSGRADLMLACLIGKEGESCRSSRREEALKAYEENEADDTRGRKGTTARRSTQWKRKLPGNIASVTGEVCV